MDESLATVAPPVDVVAVAAPVALSPATRRRRGSRPSMCVVQEGYDPWFVVGCVLFSGHLRQSAAAGAAVRDALRAALGDAAPDLLRCLESRGWRMPSVELIRQKRVQLDCAAMLYERVRLQ